MSGTIAKRTLRTYSEADRETALIKLILHGGNAEKTSELVDIPASTLKTWRLENAERYEQLRERQAPAVIARIASDAEAFALELMENERLASQVITAGLSQIDPDDAHKYIDKASAALRNLSTSKALQIDKVASPLRGRPSAITEHRDATEILREIERLTGKTVDSTAEEIPAEALSSPVDA